MNPVLLFGLLMFVEGMAVAVLLMRVLRRRAMRGLDADAG